MKHLTLSIILLLIAFICNAQLAAPNQTDTLVISSVKYNYADINKENWPCEIIYKSTTDIRIGNQTFNIVNADKFMRIVTFSVYDKNDSNKKTYKLALDEDDRGEYTLSFSGYEFTCHKKVAVKEESSQESCSYKGPSIKSCEVNGRKASHLAIPAYGCYSEGEVTVIISVNPSGQVVKAEVKDDVSSTDECLRSYALKAARLSRFTVKSDGPSNEPGEIVYTFGVNTNEQHHVEAKAQLKGRTICGGLPKPDFVHRGPKGIVVVDVWIDNYGIVVKAEAGGEGTNITDKHLWAAARAAAMKAKFNMSENAPALQKETITYIFK